MIRALILTGLLILAGPAALGQVRQGDARNLVETSAGTCDAANEASCLFDAIWQAATGLPEKKRARLAPLFLETIALSEDEGLLARWQEALKLRAGGTGNAPNYAREQAARFIAEEGWDQFLSKARAKAAPFNIGRPEIMAAGARIADDDMRSQIIAAMFDLAGPAISGHKTDMLKADYEQADFGHVLAELSMEACDLSGFERAIALTNAPDSLRYAFWRARITGNAGALSRRILEDADKDDTRHVRQALQGYAPILVLGYCGTPTENE